MWDGRWGARLPQGGGTEAQTETGKPKKVALIACARKLLTILNAMLRDNTCWGTPPSASQHSC
jgi:transposase